MSQNQVGSVKWINHLQPKDAKSEIYIFYGRHQMDDVGFEHLKQFTNFLFIILFHENMLTNKATLMKHFL